MAMNSVEMKNTVRTNTANLLTEIFEANAAVQYDDFAWAILHEVDGQEIWSSIEIKSKAWKPTKTTAAFDPYEAAAAWQEDKRIAAEKAELRKVEREAKKSKKKSEKE